MNEGLNLTKAEVEQWFLSANTAISLQLQPSPLCQGLTLLWKVSLPKNPTDRILKYKYAGLHSNYLCFLNHLYKSPAVERSFALAGQSFILINSTNGFAELVIPYTLCTWFIRKLGRQKRSGELLRDLRKFCSFSISDKNRNEKKATHSYRQCKQFP